MNRSWLILILNIRTTHQTFFCYETFLDIYNGYVKKLGLSSAYVTIDVGPENIERDITRACSKLASVIGRKRTIVIINNPWQADIVIRALRALSSVRSIVTFFTSQQADLSLEAFQFGRLQTYLSSVIGRKTVHLLRHVDQKDPVQFILDNELIDPGERTLSGGPVREPSPRLILSAFHSCVYARTIRGNSLFKAVPMPQAMRAKPGCSFCRTFKTPLGTFKPDKIDTLVSQAAEQVRQTKDRVPGSDRFVIMDMLFLGAIDRLTAALVMNGIVDVELYCASRVDLLLEHRPQLEKALHALQGTRIKIVLHLLGIENFSPRTLDLFNKGITVAQVHECLELCWHLEERYRGHFSALTGSHGFVLFTPWTTMEELKVNLQEMKRHAFERFSANVHLRSLRLTPDIPLYYKAKKDGLLLVERAGQSQAIRAGYAEDVPWKFRDPSVAQVHAFCSRFTGDQEKSPLQILERALDSIKKKSK